MPAPYEMQFKRKWALVDSQNIIEMIIGVEDSRVNKYFARKSAVFRHDAGYPMADHALAGAYFLSHKNNDKTTTLKPYRFRKASSRFAFPGTVSITAFCSRVHLGCLDGQR